METREPISDILEGRMRVLSFKNVGLGPDKDLAAGVFSALNYVRLAFAIEKSARVLPKILGLLCSGKVVEDALAVCRKWPQGVHLEADDVYHVPLFEIPLKLVSTDYDSPSPDHIAGLLENLRALNSSAAIMITRYPDVVTCLRLQASKQDVFVLFNPRVISEHEYAASLTFTTSLPQVVQQLCHVFPLDKIRPSKGNLDWQARLIEKCAGHVFVPRSAFPSSRAGEESLMVTSLTLLTLKAELEGLNRDNVGLKRDKQRLERSVVDLEAQLSKERTQTQHAQSSRPSAAKTTYGPPLTHNRGPQLTHFSPSGEGGDSSNSEDEDDPSMQYALQLQATFDSENSFLLKQKHDLSQTAQRQYHCGICLDDFPEDDAVYIDVCQHEICRDCARGHVQMKIEEHRFPVLCPVCMAGQGNQNPGTISGALVQLLGVTEKQWETWTEMEMAQFSILFDCRKCHLSGFVDKQDLEGQSEIHCPFPSCDHVWCRTCQQTIEPGGPKHSCDGTSELDHLMKQQGWRYCPNCKTPIQKIQGCNHLSCIAPGCNTHFCYRCGNIINRTAIPREIQEGKMAHFRTCSL